MCEINFFILTRIIQQDIIQNNNISNQCSKMHGKNTEALGRASSQCREKGFTAIGEIHAQLWQRVNFPCAWRHSLHGDTKKESFMTKCVRQYPLWLFKGKVQECRLRTRQYCTAFASHSSSNDSSSSSTAGPWTYCRSRKPRYLGIMWRDVCLKQAMTARLRWMDTTERQTSLDDWGWSICRAAAPS